MNPLLPLTDKLSAGGTVEAFRVRGVPVRLHFTFVILVVLLLVTGLGRESSGVFALFLAGVFVSMLLHELAHALMASRFGVRTVEIVMLPIGGLARYQWRMKPAQEIWVAAAGPLANLWIAVAIFGFMVVTSQPVEVELGSLLAPTGGYVMQRLGFVNLILAVFNLLPAFPMDGGHILRALLSMTRDDDEAARGTTFVSRTLAIGMGMYGLISANVVVVLAALFILLGAVPETTTEAEPAPRPRGVPVRAAMSTDFHRLSHDDTVRRAVSLLLSSTQQEFPVLCGEEVIGLLDRGTIFTALAAEGPDAYVAGVADREYLAVDPTLALSNALPLMEREERPALVLDGTRLIGILTPERVRKFLLLNRYGLESATARA